MVGRADGVDFREVESCVEMMVSQRIFRAVTLSLQYYNDRHRHYTFVKTCRRNTNESEP